MFSKTVLIAIFAVVSYHSAKGTPVFSGCDDEYQCVGLPKNCLDQEETPDCQVLLKTKAHHKSGKVEFNLIWKRPSNSNDSWVGAALSDDQLMGNDSAVLFIIDKNSTVSVEKVLTFVKHQNGSTKAGVASITTVGVNVTKHNYVDGVLTAKWTRNQLSSAGKLNFDMKAKKYFVLLAYGPVKNDGKQSYIAHHSAQGMSAQAIDLEEQSGKTTKPSKPSTAPTNSTTSKATSGTPSGSSHTPAPTQSSTAASKSTETGGTSKSGSTKSGSSTKSPGTTSHPKTTPKGGKGGSTALTMSLFLTIFSTILLILN